MCMKIKLLIGCVLAVTGLSSCSTITHTASTADVDTQVYNLTVADMDVSTKKVSTTVDWKWTPLSTVSIETQKENATAELLKETESDVVVEPQYTVKRRGMFRGGSVTVTGYPAKYRNFRSMTQSDAEKVSMLNGNMAVAYPMIGTSAMKPAKVKRAPKTVLKPENEKRSHKFLNVVGGLLFAPSSEMSTGGQLGLMYGKYGRSWGWYIKGVWMRIEGDEWWRPSDKYSRAENGAMFSAGVIKTITPAWNAFLGTGFGTGFSSDKYDNGYDCYNEVVPSIPIDFGVQWNLGSFNVMAGLDIMVNLENYDSSCNVSPFLGIGFSF